MSKNDELNTQLIKALVRKIKEINLLETRLALYEQFLTSEEKEAADNYAQILRRSKKYDSPRVD